MKLITNKFNLKADIVSVVENSFPASRPDFTTIAKNNGRMMNMVKPIIPREPSSQRHYLLTYDRWGGDHVIGD